MGKRWHEHSSEEQKVLMDKITAVYEEYDYPEWLQHPAISTEYVNILGKCEQKIRGGF